MEPSNHSHGEITAEQPWQALSDLVEACDGEVEEVFGGEIGEALSAARRILEKRKLVSEALGALTTEISKLDADYPNYADWPIQLPAGYWRAIQGVTTSGL
jgi:hypothetical protein